MDPKRHTIEDIYKMDRDRLGSSMRCVLFCHAFLMR